MTYRPSGTTRDLPVSIDTPRHARELLESCFVASGVDPEGVPAQNALLLLSEMATNAVVHAGGHIRVQVDVHGDGGVRIAVCDGHAHELPERRRQPGQIGGWGLELVGILSQSWGVGPRPDGATGKEVWATVQIGVPVP